MRTPVTIVIPTLNEASQIAACVRHLEWAGEVIVVDGSSTDGTAEAARAAGARVLNGVPRDLAAQRNAGIAAARHDWVLALDADERIGPALAAELAAAARAPAHEAYGVKRRNMFHGQVMRRGHWGNDWVVRFARREFRYGGSTAHPGLQGLRDVGTLTQELDHTPYRDLRHHLDKLVAYSRSGAADFMRRGRRARWSDLALRPLVFFWREYLVRGGFLDGRLGVIHAGVGAAGVLLKYAFLWELERGSDV